VLNGVYCVRRRPARPCAELYADLGAALAIRAHFPTDIDMGLNQESEHVPSSDRRLVIGDQVVRSRLEIVRETHRRQLGRAVLDAGRDCPESLDGQRLQPIFQLPIHARKSKAPDEAGPPPEGKARPIAPWDAVEINAFLDSLGGDRYGPSFTLAIPTGLRQGELRGLSWSDVALEDGMLTVARQLLRNEAFGPPQSAGLRTIGPSDLAYAHLDPKRARAAVSRIHAALGRTPPELEDVAN
jgi:integrase